MAVSIRLMKKLATLATRFTSPPSATSLSSPVMYASATCSYTSGAKSSVTLTLIPSPISCCTAGTPCGVAGILIIRLSRPTARHSRRASSSVPAVSYASVGETSRLTYPSRVDVAS